MHPDDIYATWALLLSLLFAGALAICIARRSYKIWRDSKPERD